MRSGHPCPQPGHLRQIFELAIEIAPDQRERWLRDNVPDPATRESVARLLVADGARGILDRSVLELADAIGPGIDVHS